ncbi:hypothetical protein GCM10011533_09460 [Streptosporangium jomthongense]|uniref:Lipoprotein n=1 Tax=Marinobacter aromaticivorans TaxID=1494078 RepID=A0ABW2ISU4_9GAMM|nr:hypothetical protein [Marinobacter aromaticivorans]GGE59041.1 hypothetical protein GCM10011533_09460 [Streptosporangium jomthongense]
MKDQTFVGRWIVISGATFLVACGGSGGGDESSKVTLSYDTENYAEKGVEISSNTNLDGVFALYDDLNEGFDLVEDIRTILISQSGGVSGTTNCDAGGTATVKYAGEGWNDDEVWELTDCVVSTYDYGDVFLNGSYRYVDTLTGESDTSESWKGFESFNVTGELKRTGEPLRLKGRADWDQAYQWDNTTESGRVINTIDAFELRIGDRYVAILNAETRLEGTEFDAEYAMSGKLIGSAIGGYIQMSTPTPLAISDYENCPTAGVIRLSSDGAAEVRYGSSAGGTATAVAIWVDGQIVESYDDCSSVGFTPVY